MNPVTLRELLEAGAHFGHQTKRWNPRMRPYIFGARNGIYIIDLQKTVVLFQQALDFVKDITLNGNQIVFVGTKPQAREIVREEAERAGMPFVTTRWLGGTMTNYATIKKSIARLIDLETMKADGTFELLAKKEGVRREKNRLRLDKFLGGIKDMKGLPKAVFVIDAGYEHIAVREAQKLHIPVLGLVDTNSSPQGIDYVLPGNDDALRSIRLFASRVADAAAEGASLRQETGKEDREAIAATGDSVAEEMIAAAQDAPKGKSGDSKDSPESSPKG